MITNTEPLIFEPEELEDPILAMTRDDRRIVPLIETKQRLLLIHARLHQLGHADHPAHDECLIELHRTETALNACWIAPLN